MPSSTSTKMYSGAVWASISDAGGTARPPLVDAVIGGRGDFVSSLSAAKLKGVRCIIKFVGASALAQDASGNFSLVSWKLRMDEAFNKNGSGAAARSALSVQMANFVLDGTLMGNYMLDDFKYGSNIFNTVPTMAEIESCAQYSKSVWPAVPCAVRGENTYLEDGAGTVAGLSKWSYLDYGWGQWMNRFGVASTYYSNNVNAGKRIGLGFLCGLNFLNAGSGITAPWNIRPGQTGVSGNLFGMSPQEIDACKNAFLAVKDDVLGMQSWTCDTQFDHLAGADYYDDYTGINEAMTRLHNATLGLLQGPFNQRATVVTPPPATEGDWAQVGTTKYQRGTGATALQVNMPDDVQTDNLVLLWSYSRDDSFASAIKPTGWSEAKAYSAASNKGGQLVLWYRLYAGQTSETVTFSGTGSASGSVLLACAAFSGNTTTAANLLSTTGSSRSWASGSAMGPVAGLTSARSDALVLLSAARANDFGTGGDSTTAVGTNNLPATNVMSATTHDLESWSRLFIAATTSGDDAGLFVDWAGLSGKPSITSKSWSQTTTAQSGAGAGFMASFCPAVETGTVAVAPAFTELEDVTFSLGATLAFTTNAAGTAPITYSVTSGPASIALNSSTGAFSWTPSATGTYYLILGASNVAGTDTEDFFVVVNAVASVINVAPVFTGPGSYQTAQAGHPISFTVTATDADGDALTYTMDENAPQGAALDMTTGQFLWTPAADSAGLAVPVVFIVDDGQHQSSSTVTITVTDPNPWSRQPAPHGASFQRI